MDENIAVVAVQNGNSRGLIVNERGMNRIPMIGRVAIAHGLGHVLCGCSDGLAVNSYDAVEANYALTGMLSPANARAGSFAMHFLARSKPIIDMSKSKDTTKLLEDVMFHF
ncbi:MAG: hypothetical protein WCI94_04915 [Rhodospirillales bacterium]